VSASPDSPPRAAPHRLVDPASPGYRWWLLLVTSLGALLASITSGTLVIALPQILRDLHTDLFALLSIVVGYTLVVTVLVLNAGRLADRYGRVRTFTLGLAIFTAASAFCAIAPDAITLIGGRIAQGVGGAFMFANSSALVTDAFPRRELGRALGINATVVGAGLMLGPILGGWLTGFGWRFVFWFNVPLGILGVLAAWLILVERVPPQRQVGNDWLGNPQVMVAVFSGTQSGASGSISSRSSGHCTSRSEPAWWRASSGRASR
jgi:MFS family permease